MFIYIYIYPKPCGSCGGGETSLLPVGAKNAMVFIIFCYSVKYHRNVCAFGPYATHRLASAYADLLNALFNLFLLDAITLLPRGGTSFVFIVQQEEFDWTAPIE